MPKKLIADAGRKRLKHPYARISALMCIAGLVLELGLLLKHHFWGGYPPDARLALGLAGALLVNLYFMRESQTASK